jgi:triosephosphate isomerase
MRKPVIAGNWKMHKLIAEAAQSVIALKPLVSQANCEVIVAPAYPALRVVADRLEGSNIRTAGQDLAPELKQGAFTGEVSGEMLRDAGCTHVIIGHSERRQYYAETDELVNQKVRSALSSGLTPIVCVGESLEERDAGRAGEVVERQLEKGLRELTAEELIRIIIAYEPVWAIGTGRTATPDSAQKMHAFIRSRLGELFGQEAATAVRILYGGSVKPDNIAELMREADIDGALVGGASLDPESFARIVNYHEA